MKTPEQIHEYLKYIRAQTESLIPESMKPNAPTETIIAAAVSEEIESTFAVGSRPGNETERASITF